ncbi:MAG: Swt1 family HEPN domain-containing protein [Pseudomonadota bacterium]|nr:Swt1 family HEPN domain-containing protein [Pseudomonadota bacterium]
MAISNHERVGKALDLLKAGLAPFVEREVKAAVQSGLGLQKIRNYAEDPIYAEKSISEWDSAGQLKLMWELWNEVFRNTLGHAERSLVSELRDVRNRWAHQNPFSSDDAYRALDSMGRLLVAVSAPQADDIERMKQELLRVKFDEQARTERRKVAGTLIETQAAGSLKPWRQVIHPHRDVASGKYQQAEFAADLWQVHLGEGSDEYRKPNEFFRRTFLTESLRRLLVGALQRLSGDRGDPVVQLQTNFGGGKTHSMLALYHLLSSTPTADLPGIEPVLQEAGIAAAPNVRRVVLVGNKISPGNPVIKNDGTEVRTLWGEMAWQLGGRQAFDRIRQDDERATNPGDRMRELFNEYGPALILIDEWVAYARQLHDQGDLPGGSFETHFTFAQALTESAKLAKNTLLVVSLPASDSASSSHAQADDVEVGGIRGREALSRLRNAIGRVESSWRPASSEEGFEIVRRRLFEPMSEREQFVAHDNTARAFSDLYHAQQQEFPPECRGSEYERRLKAAYPIHPEIFDRLYEDWSTLLKFQRTRGVLRLMAAVIHSLWERGDQNPLIMPASLPLDDERVQFEMTRYLSDNWPPVIAKDVDGPNSLPLRMDGEVPNLGKYSACRRVARTIYMGSAPMQGAANRGVEDRKVKLGCVLPGETPAIFGDALRRMSTAATYLYQDGTRYWYSTQPTVTKLAEDRAEQLTREPDKVAEEIKRRLNADLRSRGDFSRAHVLPASSADVPDDMDARLVVLDIDAPHTKTEDSAALAAAKAILENRGSSPRLYRNSLVFLAADKTRLADLDDAVRRYLAWQSIVDEAESLDLTPHQKKTSITQRGGADGMVIARIPETYQWLLVPGQYAPTAAVEWQAIRLTGTNGLAQRAAKKLKNEELLVVAMAASRLRLEIDRVPLWRTAPDGNQDHVEIKQLAEDFARYLYLPRLQTTAVVTEAIIDGVKLLTWEQDAFAYAESYDEAARRYRGLKAGQIVRIAADAPAGLIVKPGRARKQLDQEMRDEGAAGDTGHGTGTTTGTAGGSGTTGGTDEGPQPRPQPRRFHGTVQLDAGRTGRDASKVADEVVAHLVGLVGAEVTVTLEISARIPDGAPENVVRIVTENCRTLKFDDQGFESE